MDVSGLYGSYKVPSRSSLLPLRTLSPGGSDHSLTWRESLTGPTTCSSNFKYLSHLEGVLYKLSNKPHKIKHYMSTIIHENPDTNTQGSSR
jgi:hypothetical protein